MIGLPSAEPIVSLSEAHAYLRLESGDEEALLVGLLRTSSGLCETFLNQAVLRRDFVEQILVSTEWQRLRVSPVRSIQSVDVVGQDGSTRQLAATEFTVDIDARGDGWVRLLSAVEGARLEVTGTAGLAAGINQVPEPIRQGVLRLTAHMFANRDGSAGEPPASVTALWRPYRRMRLG